MSLLTINRSLGLQAPRLNELGKIKIGGLGKTNGSGDKTWRSPEKYDHFVITTMHRKGGKGDGDLIQDTALMAELLEKYGSEDKKLRQIPIWLPTDELTDALQTSWVWYRGKTQVGARSDGDQVTWYCDPRTGEVLAEPQVGPWKDKFASMTFNKAPMFKLNTVLNCMVLSREARVAGGIYKFRTTSKITYERLYSSLTDIANTTGGILRNLPLVMVVDPVRVKPKGVASTVYAVRIELRGSDIRAIQEQALEERRWRIENKVQADKLERDYRRLLMAPGTETGQELREVVAEFYPEQANAIPAAPAGKIDILDGILDEPETPPQSGTEINDPSANDVPPGQEEGVSDPDVVDAQYSDGPAAPAGEKYVDHIDDAADFEKWEAQQKADGAEILDSLGIDQPPPPKQMPQETPAERELTEAALKRDSTPKPVTAQSTVDELLVLIVEHRPTAAGKRMDPVAAYGMAQQKLKLFLPKPWAKLKEPQRLEAIEKVKAGRFPWPNASKE